MPTREGIRARLPSPAAVLIRTCASIHHSYWSSGVGFPETKQFWHTLLNREISLSDITTYTVKVIVYYFSNKYLVGICLHECFLLYMLSFSLIRYEPALWQNLYKKYMLVKGIIHKEELPYSKSRVSEWETQRGWKFHVRRKFEISQTVHTTLKRGKYFKIKEHLTHCWHPNFILYNTSF